MKAPSPLGLQALRLLALTETRSSCTLTNRRTYASQPSQKDPKPTQKQPPPPAPFNKPVPSDLPGYKLRAQPDDSDEFQPTPLSRPIGMPYPPVPGDNMGLDLRSLRQRRDDFVNYEKHLQKRSRMTKQISKPYFRDWSNLRFHKGKQFVAPPRLFRAEHALFFPNFFGKTLRKDAARVDSKDGYRGYGRNSCEATRGKVSVVSIVSSQWAVNQTATFVSPKQNAALHQVLADAKDCAQMVEINREENWLKWWILQLFKGNLRRTRSLEEQGRYFMVYRGVSDVMKEAIGLLNDVTGYVYLVDEENRIRWAGSANAEPEEKESLVSCLSKLIHEARMPKSEKPQPSLEDAVDDVTGRESKAATA